MRLSRFAFIIGFLAVVLGSAAAQVKPEDAARKSGEAWLASIDAGKYGPSYDGSAAMFKAQVTKEKWSEMVRTARTGTGAFKSRTLLTADYTESLPGAPVGKYVVIRFDSKFAAGPFTEQLVMTQEKDGDWRAIGYFVRPPQ